MTPIEAALISALASVQLSNGVAGVPSYDDTKILATIAYNEMGNQSIECKAMAVQTVLNRYAHKDTIYEVVSIPQHYAWFPPRIDPNKILEMRAWERSIDAAILTYTGLVEIPEQYQNITHFHKGSRKPETWGPEIERAGYMCGHTWYVEMAR